jgi:hypothetical protein
MLGLPDLSIRKKTQLGRKCTSSEPGLGLRNWGHFQFGALKIKLHWTFTFKTLYGHRFSFFLGKYQRVEWFISEMYVLFTRLKKHWIVLLITTPVCIPTSIVSTGPSHACQHLILSFWF